MAGLLQLSKIWKINGKPIFEPSSYELYKTGIQVKADRSTADGILHKETIRNRVIGDASISYDLMTDEESGYMFNLVMPGAEFFNLTYKDFGSIGVAECYANDFRGSFYHANFLNGLWKNINFACIER